MLCACLSSPSWVIWHLCKKLEVYLMSGGRDQSDSRAGGVEGTGLSVMCSFSPFTILGCGS